MTDTNAFLMPPAKLLATVTDPNTKQPGYAFPLQTAAWLKMQTVVSTALTFPLDSANFVNLYGAFSDEGMIQSALTILTQIKTTSAKYGDPTKLIDQLSAFQQAKTAPDSIYGGAVWLAAQTMATALNIQSQLNEGLTEIATEKDPKTRIADLTELLTGEGGINEMANALQTLIVAFQANTKTFYDELNSELTGQTNSLTWYLTQSGNVYQAAKDDVTTDQGLIDGLNTSIDELNKEYIGFTVAASVSPVFLVIPFFGIFIAAADATTFGILATKTKDALDAAKKQRDQDTDDMKKKTTLVTQLGYFNTSALDVKNDGVAFLNAIGTMAAGWGEFQTQITSRLSSLTVKDVEDWSAFMDKVNFKTSLAGWQLIGSKAETFYQTGFIKFTQSP